MTQLDAALRSKRKATVLEHMTAENAYEFERCIGAFSHPRYEIIPTGETWDGHDGVIELLWQNKTAFPDFQFHPSAMHFADDAVLVEGRLRGTHLGIWRGLPPTGKAIDLPLIIAFLFKEDEMVCERTYFDLGTVLQQLGFGRDPNSLGGRAEMILNHPFALARAYVRGLIRR